MSGTVSFKVYMTAEEDSAIKQIRRFGIEVDVVTNFLYLREKIQTIFPALRGKHFSVSWKDSDNDDVSISSDEELGIALSETAANDIRKLYVLLHSEYATDKSVRPTQLNQGTIHSGITCDGCNGQVCGYRYKCIQCQDYDLCMECEGRGIHAEHCMIRLPVPLQRKPHMTRRLANHANKFMKRAQSYKTTGDEQKQCPFRSGKCHGKPHQSGEDASWLDTLAGYLDEWANLPGECPTKETAAGIVDDAAKKANPEPAATTSQENSPRCGDANPSEQIKLFKDAIGLVVGDEFLTKFLDPFINMHPAAANVETPTTSEASSAPSPSTSNEKEAAPTAPNGAVATPKFPGEGQILGDTTVTNEALPTQERKQSAEKTSIENELGWTVLNKSDSSASSIASGISASTGAVPKQVQPSAPTEAASKPIYPTLAPEKEFYHSNETIQKAVESMVQMGFSNNGGWLTNLLLAKGGDIAAALDALSPARR